VELGDGTGHLGTGQPGHLGQVAAQQPLIRPRAVRVAKLLQRLKSSTDGLRCGR
jgi:hypothetical protein